MAMDTEEVGGMAEAMSEPGVPESLKPRPIAARNPDENWGIVYHRIQYGRDGKGSCDCPQCISYLAVMHEKYWKGHDESALLRSIREAKARQL